MSAYLREALNVSQTFKFPYQLVRKASRNVRRTMPIYEYPGYVRPRGNRERLMLVKDAYLSHAAPCPCSVHLALPLLPGMAGSARLGITSALFANSLEPFGQIQDTPSTAPSLGLELDDPHDARSRSWWESGHLSEE
jgi:hypothetical protein